MTVARRDVLATLRYGGGPGTTTVAVAHSFATAGPLREDTLR